MERVTGDGKYSKHYFVQSSKRQRKQLHLSASAVFSLAEFASSFLCFFYFSKAIDFCSVAIRKQAYKLMYSCILKWTFRLLLSFYWFPSPADCCLSQHVVTGLWRSRSGWCHLKPKRLCNNVQFLDLLHRSKGGHSRTACTASVLTGSIWLIASCN